VWRHARRERGALLLVEEHFEVAARLRADGTLQRADDPDAPDVIDDVVDGLVHAGVIADDGPEHVHEVRYRQVKVRTKREEKTILEIEAVKVD
jgi:hypothetical protein